MARVPFLGRLFWREYLALVGSLILVAFEVVIRVITLGLPQPIIRLCYNASRALFNRLSSPTSKRARSQKKDISHSIATCSDFTELCGLWGYYAEEHIVQTKDGYLLGVHRLPFKKGEEQVEVRVNAGSDSISKPVVYLHHGLLMNSEVWVCMTEEERCLPFQLANQRYDVWLGNNRGNKYSKKSTQCSPSSTRFWNFSIDDFAFHDIPDTINYILTATAQPSLSYIGFSQGTAQAFATLAIHPDLNDKVNLFIALAPAMSPAGLKNGIVDALVKTSPDLLFLAFGRKSILSSATMWQSILYPPIFVRLIDMSLSFLFGWYSRNMTAHQKLAAYPHLYSFTSTKSVVHWFQIIRNKSFQMYDDDSSGKFSITATNRYYKPAKFPTRNIKTPIVLVYGGSDSLVDIRVMLKELPLHTIASEIAHYEHLDFLWAQDVDKLVFPHVFEALRYAVSHASGSVNGTSRYLAAKLGDISHLHRRKESGSQWSEDEGGSSSDYDTTHDSSMKPTPGTKSYAQQQRDAPYATAATSTPTPIPTPKLIGSSADALRPKTPVTPVTSGSPTATWVAQQRKQALTDGAGSGDESGPESLRQRKISNSVSPNNGTDHTPNQTIKKRRSRQLDDELMSVGSGSGRMSPATIPHVGAKGISIPVGRPTTSNGKIVGAS
ncbi:cholesterol esterase [Knufia obscura]|uniref:Cholesterol esterase n=1 Tax=Knufia obscura TaxID=1635080 RepID=A0ABR0RN55_9EURO|nr:cholesterol esterase [Knufia obscura]